MLRRDHWRVMPLATVAHDFRVAPFISQATTSPVEELDQIRSAFPSPSKSPTPESCHGLPKPVRPVASVAHDFVVAPSISHSTTSPESGFSHTRSALPSPSRSPTPATVQFEFAPENSEAQDLIEVPFISHSETSPVCRSCQIRSCFPSPSRSPIPAINQLGPSRENSVDHDFIVAPSISHAATSPVWELRQMISALPSPSKSAVAAISHVRSTPRAIGPFAVIPVPSINTRVTSSVRRVETPAPAVCENATIVPLIGPVGNGSAVPDN